MIFHTLNGHSTSSAFSDCIRQLNKNDAILLLGNGVYNAMANTDAVEQLLATGAELYVLEPDALAAGICEKVDDRIKTIDFDTFVALSERYCTQLAWY